MINDYMGRQQRILLIQHLFYFHQIDDVADDWSGNWVGDKYQRFSSKIKKGVLKKLLHSFILEKFVICSPSWFKFATYFSRSSLKFLKSMRSQCKNLSLYHCIILYHCSVSLYCIIICIIFVNASFEISKSTLFQCKNFFLRCAKSKCFKVRRDITYCKQSEQT